MRGWAVPPPMRPQAGSVLVSPIERRATAGESLDQNEIAILEHANLDRRRVEESDAAHVARTPSETPQDTYTRTVGVLSHEAHHWPDLV